MTTIDRRTFVRGAAFGIVAGALAPTLASCSTQGVTGSSTIASKLAPLPTYVPILKGPKPDLQGTATVQPVFFKPVTETFQSVSGKIGNGSAASALVLTYSPPPSTNNPFLQYIDSKADVKLDMTYVPADSYSNKFATVMAGGDIPDFVQFLAFNLPPRFPDLLNSLFADLTDHLSGDAVKKYPNLANIPTPSWQGCRINGRIFGVPTPRPAFGNPLAIRKDLIEQQVGATLPNNKSDFTSFCRDLTSAKANRYALGGYSQPTGVNFSTEFINGMFRVPNNWRHSGGKLTHQFETAEWLDAVSYTRQLWSAGVYHPDTTSMQISQLKTYFRSGTILMYTDGISALSDSTLPPELKIDAFVPFGVNGGPGVNYQTTSMFSFTALKKASASRVEELLRVMNYLAAPNGSKESIDIQWGQESADYTKDSAGNRVPTSQGEANVNTSNLYYITGAPAVLSAKSPAPTQETLTRVHAYEQKTSSMLVSDPTVGHYSPTAATAGSATLAVQDAVTNYVTGRAGITSVKSAVASWKSSVGDKMKAEYLKSINSN